MSDDPWLHIADSLPLSRAEMAVLKRYAQDPNGRSFLALADIFLAHDRATDAIELLSLGVERHPGFTVARVVLARELFSRGLLVQCWQTMEDSPVGLDDNLLAQKLKLKTAALFGWERTTWNVFDRLRSYALEDEEVLAWRELFENQGLDALAKNIEQYLVRSDVQILIPKDVARFAPPEERQIQAQQSSAGQSAPSSAPKSGGSTPKLIDISLTKPEARGFYGSQPVLEQFHVVPLNEIFAGPSGEPVPMLQLEGSGIELDSTTLADIFVRQGHYRRALDIYKRLLRMAPQNEFLRRKVADIQKLQREQKEDDLSIDPQMVDQLEALEIVDEQTKFYTELLNRLGG